jgi:hypothetical protein
MLQRLLRSGSARAANYGSLDGPRFARHRAPSAAASFDGSLHVVTLNIQFARGMTRALELFSRIGSLGLADVVLLQEMGLSSTFSGRVA